MRGWFVLVVLLLACTDARAQSGLSELRLDAPGVSGTPIRVHVLLPPEYFESEARYPVLYMNDGQDLQAVGAEATLQQLYATHDIEPVIVVAIDMPPDRIAGYGLFDRSARHSIPAQTEYGPVGLNAWAYAQWITGTLVPAIDALYRTRPSADQRAILGWSLGGLSAFGIGWQYPDVFGLVGAFSPSFWVSADRSDTDAINATRLVHRLVDAGAPITRPRLFFAVGSTEETDDRDGDGIMDMLDDTRDLLQGWQAADGNARKGLQQWGYSVNLDYAGHASRDAAVLYVLDGGRHNQASWGRVLPVFLHWAYGVQAHFIDASDLRLPTSIEAHAPPEH